MIKEFRKPIIIILLLFVGGSVGYSIIEGWDFLDSLYMTIITLSTTGFREIRPLSIVGRIFTMALIIVGISILFYVLGKLNTAIFEGNIFRGRKMQKKIDSLQNHYIICGFGRIGKKICLELEKRNKTFVVIENDKERLELCKDYLYVYGDGTEDDNLINAGIERAVGLVAVLENDASNVFVVLSARGLNHNLKIIARAEEESSREKLLKAGANRVILPYEIGGFRITQALLKPTVLEYYDEVFSRSELDLEIEEVKISEGSSIIGKTLAEAGIRSKLNIIIIGIYRSGGDWIYNPRSDTKFNLDDTLIVIGETHELQQLQEITKDDKL